MIRCDERMKIVNDRCASRTFCKKQTKYEIGFVLEESDNSSREDGW